LATGVSLGQDTTAAPPAADTTGATPAPDAPPTIDTSRADAGDDDLPEPRRRWVKWNEFEGPVTTFRFGFGFLTDFATYIQDDASKQQFSMNDDVGVRDFRLLFRGKFQTQRPFSWTIGYMYDAADDEWRFRQTDIQIGFPEAKGSLFIGRTKEGYSMIKVMTGYHPWTQERSPGLDAFVPILADGIKWMGYFPEARVFYSIGAYLDALSNRQTFSTYHNEVVTRIGWLPIASEEDKTVWHVAVMARSGEPDEGDILYRSKPEDSLSPYFVETPQILTDRARTTGIETYYRRGSWLFGGEYDWQTTHPDTGDNPTFHAGDVVAVWLITGETRGYNARGGYFHAVSPDRTVFEGGPGAWEAVFHASYIDLDDRGIHGGKLWRFTPMVNWHLSDNMRLEFVYGYSTLDRFDLQGHTQFLQARVQFTL
jgi:phosphate-selective porin OprO/OprP